MQYGLLDGGGGGVWWEMCDGGQVEVVKLPKEGGWGYHNGHQSQSNNQNSLSTKDLLHWPVESWCS